MIGGPETYSGTRKSRGANSRGHPPKPGTDVPPRAWRATSHSQLCIERSRDAWQRIVLPFPRTVGTNRTGQFDSKGTVEALGTFPLSPGVIRSLRAVHGLKTWLGSGEILHVGLTHTCAWMAVETFRTGHRTA